MAVSDAVTTTTGNNTFTVGHDGGGVLQSDTGMVNVTVAEDVDVHLCRPWGGWILWP